MHKRKTLEQMRLFQGHCDLIISKLFSPDTPRYYLDLKNNGVNRKLIQDQKL